MGEGTLATYGDPLSGGGEKVLSSGREPAPGRQNIGKRNVLELSGSSSLAEERRFCRREENPLPGAETMENVTFRSRLVFSLAAGGRFSRRGENPLPGSKIVENVTFLGPPGRLGGSGLDR